MKDIKMTQIKHLKRKKYNEMKIAMMADENIKETMNLNNNRKYSKGNREKKNTEEKSENNITDLTGLPQTKARQKKVNKW